MHDSGRDALDSERHDGRYLKKALGELRATASVPVVAAGPAHELHALVEVRDAGNDIVFDADITMWVSPKA